MNHAVHLAKADLRRRLRMAREALSSADAVRAMIAATARLTALPRWREAKVIALYADVRGELGTALLDADARDRGVLVVYPRVVAPGAPLAFHACARVDLAPGVLGIPTPHATAPALLPEQLDLVVVPGLAFDPVGHRLGWGRGYYDLTLPLAARAVKVGFAHELQVVPDVPRAEFDQRMDLVVTDAALRCGAAPPRLLPSVRPL